MDSYAAGLIDGEGYIGIIKDNSNRSYNLRVQVTMSDKGLSALERMKDKYGGSISKDNKATNRVRQAYGWTVTGRKAVELLRIIQPDSMVKKEVIDIALRYWSLIERANKKPNGQVEWTPELEAKASYYQELIKEKNRRGPDPVEFSDNPMAVYYAGSWWKTEEDEDGPVLFDKRFPPQGTTRSGRLFERPRWEHLIRENESSSSPGSETDEDLLPAPTTAYSARSPEKWREDRPAGNGQTRKKIGDLQVAVKDLDQQGKAFPTPKASDAFRGENTPSEKRRESPALTAVDIFFEEEVKKFPTPTASDGDKERNNPAQAKRKSPPLSAVSTLFPEEVKTEEGETSILGTPQARDGRGGPAPGFNKGNLNHNIKEIAQWNELPESTEDNPLDSDDSLHNTTCNWGQYEPSVRRWEAVLGRPAPSPIEPNRNGKPRLTAKFVEWMMGLDEGWVTDVPGIARVNQIKILGNGVVPSQAEAALRILMERIPVPPED